MAVLNFFNKYRLEITNFFVGAVVLSFELTAARVVAPYIGTTIYTWTSVIGVILAALALGYGFGGYIADKRKRVLDVVLLLCAAALAILLVDLTKDWLLEYISQNRMPLRWQALIASFLLFSIPTFLLGAVSPYLARLNIKSVSSSGFSLARINAAGTVGSLFGTFITGYWLFGYVGTRNLLVFLALCLVAISFLLEYRSYLVLRLAVVVLAYICLVASPQLKLIGIQKDIDTRYSRIAISDRYYGNRPVRILQTDSLAWQSGVFLDGDTSLVFDYTRAFVYAAAAKPDSNDYLVIGGGAFTLPSYLARSAKNATVDTVEIDDKLPHISQRYFGFNKPANMKVVAADGRQFINRNTKKYDVIFVDAFSSITPPFQLFTKESVGRIHASLKNNGLAVVNLISAGAGPDSQMAGAISTTYKQYFSSVKLFQIRTISQEKQMQNLLLVASDNPSLLADLQKNAAGQEAQQIFSKPLDENYAYQKVLTDDFAPVERLSTSGI